MNPFKRAQIDLKNKSRLMDNRFGESSPIDNKKLPNMPRGSAVVISKEVKQVLDLIQELTAEERIEIPFLLCGKNEGQVVYFDKVVAGSSGLSGTEADFSSLVPDLQEFINKSPKNGTDIVAHGHSHPKSINNYHLNFSLGDMNAYKNFRLDNPVFATGKIELCSCLLTGGNYNFLFFDGNDYYKFEHVYVQDKNGNIVEQLPCYRSNFVNTNDRGRY